MNKRNDKQLQLIIIIILLFIVQSKMVNVYAQGATVRSADIAVVGFNTDDNNYTATTSAGDFLLDRFALVALNDIPGNSVIFITDRGWRDNTFMITNGDFTIKFTVVSGGISAGTIIRFDPSASTVVSATLGTTVDNSHITRTDDGRAGLSLTSTGDQIFIYQTANDTRDGSRERQNTTMTGTESGFIYCFSADNYVDNNNDGWSDDLTADSWSRSEFPNLNNMTLVTSGSTGDAFGIFLGGASEQDNLRYNGSTAAANKATWLARINTPSNWSMGNDTPYDLTTGALTSNYTVTDPLPVELVSFNVAVNNNSIILYWETATEVNNYGFEIEKAILTDDWQKVGFVTGHGNSNSPKEYTYKDEHLGGSDFKYRLKQIDIDGQYEYSQEVEVKLDVPAEFSLKQNFPNPFNPTTKIIYSIPQKANVQIIIYNALGMEVTTLLNEFRQAGMHQVEFDANNLSSGIYFYKVVSGNYSEIKKMILLR
jgi:Secretion system C-terminal sorting domain